MTPDQILSHPPRVLTQAQRERYFETGYLLLPGIVATEWIARLRTGIGELVERSRKLTESNSEYDLETEHSAASPRLRRIVNPSSASRAVWEYVSDAVVADIAADLLGPDVKFLDTQMNFKWARGGTEIKWHQDITYFPHTNYSLLTIGTMLEDVGPEQGPMGVIPGSHRGPIFELYDKEGRWIGTLRDHDMATVDFSKAAYLMGPAGSIQVHSCRTLHGSAQNNSDRSRPLLLATYSSADAFPYVPYPVVSDQTFRIVRGRPAVRAHLDPEPCPLPPDWSKGKGYQSIFVWQQKEDVAMTGGAP
ncbi:MAG: phytanoyl-CoA dioxygenase family protein [Alphaproteobacteria bacterium]